MKNKNKPARFAGVRLRKVLPTATDDVKEVDVKGLILEGKTQLECVEAILKSSEKIEPAAAIEMYIAAKRLADASDLIDEAAKKSVESKVEDAAAQSLAEKAMEKMDVPGILEKQAELGNISLKERKGEWKRDQHKMFKLLVKAKKDGPGADHSELAAHRQKFQNIWRAKLAGNVTDVSADGGDFVRPEFDPEVDSLVYRDSELINAVQIRRGGDKTEINSISNFDFVDRADQNAAFAETKVTTTKLPLEYRETGAIVPVAEYLLEESEHDFVGELMEAAADAKIRKLEPAITTGKVSDGDFFDGIRFTSGITAFNIAAAGGTGKLKSQDLTNAYGAAASQTRRLGSFVLDTKELLLLIDERDSQNEPIKTVMMVNGQWMHLATGRPIVVSDLMSRDNNALVSNAGGAPPEVGALFGVLPRFRIYQRGALDIATSDQIFFKENQIGFRFILRYKFGVPTRSLSSFVTLQGVENNPVT